jgi:hypothetical protein
MYMHTFIKKIIGAGWNAFKRTAYWIVPHGCVRHSCLIFQVKQKQVKQKTSEVFAVEEKGAFPQT